MPSTAPTSAALRNFLRSSATASLRQTSQFSSFALFQQQQSQSPTRPHSPTTSPFSPRSRSRSHSPPPPYIAFPSTPARQLCLSSTHWTHMSTPYSLRSIRTFHSTRSQQENTPPAAPSSSPTAAQDIEVAIEEITDLYGSARDEFEIATEETDKNTTYAADDRAAAREELDRLLEFYTRIINGQDPAVAQEVKRRVGQRVRELESAVLALEERAKHAD